MRESTEYELRIEETHETFETWTQQPFISENLRSQLSQENVLLVPRRGYFTESDILYFPQGTEELLRFFRESDVKGLSVDICIEDEDFKTLTLHADILTITEVVVTSVLARLVANLISDHIKHRLGKRKDEAIVVSKLTVCDEIAKRSVEFSYKGPAPQYRGVMNNALKEITTHMRDSATASHINGDSDE